MRTVCPENQFAVTSSSPIGAGTQIDVTYPQIQYTQIVLHNFNNLSWPHVSVATLVPDDPVPVSLKAEPGPRLTSHLAEVRRGRTAHRPVDLLAFDRRLVAVRGRQVAIPAGAVAIVGGVTAVVGRGVAVAVQVGQFVVETVEQVGAPKHDNIRMSTLPVTTPSSNSSAWPRGGEYDPMENGEPGQPFAGALNHFPSLDGQDRKREMPNFTVDMRQWNNFAFEWTAGGLKGWVNGEEWYTPRAARRPTARTSRTWSWAR